MEPEFGYLERVRLFFGDREREGIVSGTFTTHSDRYYRVKVQLSDGVEIPTACRAEEMTRVEAA